MCPVQVPAPAGNVRINSLAEIFAGETWRNLLAQVPRHQPRGCNPGSDGNDCGPAETFCEGDALTLPLIPSLLFRPDGGAR